MSRCRKRRYRDQMAALRALGWLDMKIATWEDEDRGKRPVRAYQCPTCRGWHLTSLPKAQG